MADTVQSFNSLLESLRVPLKAAVDSDSSTSIEAISCIAQQLMIVFQCLNHPSMKAILTAEYAKSLVLDNVLLAIEVISPQLLAGKSIKNIDVKNTDKKKKKRSDSTLHDESFLLTSEEGQSLVAEMYQPFRVLPDVGHLLLCVGSARSAQLQQSCLALLKRFMGLHPGAAGLAVEVLGCLLAAPAMGATLTEGWNRGVPGGRDGPEGEGGGLMGRILRTLVSAMPTKVISEDVGGEDGSSPYLFQPQDVLQPLCARFPAIPAARRVALLQVRIVNAYCVFCELLASSLKTYTFLLVFLFILVSFLS